MVRSRALIAAVSLSCACSQPSLAQPILEQRSAELSQSYLRTWSANGHRAVAEVPRLYSPKIRFYGRIVDRHTRARWNRG